MESQQVAKNLAAVEVPPARRGRGISENARRILELSIGGEPARFRRSNPNTIRSIARYWSRGERTYVTRRESETVIAVYRIQ